MKPESVLDKILEDASRFHCHLGPFLALGVKAGLRAVEALGYDPFKMRARVIVPKLSTPYTCFADGIQFVTGCTLGKLNIEIVEGEGLGAEFILDSKKLELRVRDEILARLEKASNPAEEGARRLMRSSFLELFREDLTQII